MISPRLVAIVILASALIWALTERSMRLACAAESARLDAQVRVLGSAIGQQNAALDKLAKEGEQARARGAQARATAARAITGWTESQNHLQASIELLQAPAPPAGIAAGSCGHALAVVREDLK